MYPFEATKKFSWQCSKHIAHEWEAVIYNRTRENALGCPYCNLGWTIENIRMFVASLLQYIEYNERGGITHLVSTKRPIEHCWASKEVHSYEHLEQENFQKRNEKSLSKEKSIS